MTRLAEYGELDGLSLARLVERREVQPRELVEAAIERIERIDPVINAVILRTFETALERAERNIPEGPFRGVPFLLKDLGVAYAGTPTTAGSRSRSGLVAATNSELVERHLRAGLVVVGKTNVPELGLAPTTEPELHGPTRNPWDLSRTAGGSSGGSAAAVAARLVPMAHASDGGGSIRIPASACGLFGLKPTRGRTPSDAGVGEAWFGLSADHVVSRSVRDSAALLDATRGAWIGAPYAAPPVPRPYRNEVGADPGPLRIAFCPTPLMGSRMDPECDAAVREAAALCAQLGHRVEEAAPPIDAEALTVAFLRLVAADTALQIEEAAAQAGGGAAPEDYETVTWFVGLAGRTLRGTEMASAWREMRRAGRTMAGFFEAHDVLLTPTLARPPWPLGELDPDARERSLLSLLRRAPVRPAVRHVFRQLAETRLELIPNTPLFNLTGQPAASVPLHWTEAGLPVGVQLAARFGEESTLFRLSSQLEEARPWAGRVPDLAT